MRKLVLVVALMSAVGLGFGRLTEEMCSLGGSFADDPTNPVITAEYALPSHAQTAPRATIPIVAVRLFSLTPVPAGVPGLVPEAQSAVLPSLQSPRRC